MLGRGSTPLDFARYAAWEISLERLRMKRCKRLRIKSTLAHSGPARIFQIFDRGTRKHFGDLGLWMSYLQYARETKANKKFKTVLTSAIRMHCAKPEVWLYAAKYTLEAEQDVDGARSYMQRGTRFCTRSRELWVEYARLEMIFLTKIAMRRRILGLDGKAEEEQAQALEVGAEEESNGFEEDADMIAIPKFSDNMLRQSMVEGVKVDAEAVQDPATTPALMGAIPMAIFDDAKRQPFYCAAAAEEFFDMFATFQSVPCQARVMQHVLDSMTQTFPADPATCNCYVRQPIVGIKPMSVQFPMALSNALDRLIESTEKVKERERPELAKKTVAWVEPILAVENLDPGIQTVLRHTLRKLQS